ncbi:unnamed protein product (macronuclear) [Paramecium tetraurelia]|uniref:Protein kinase domain-containing protein n=1 Tax=Paramecium tetraurelia TaxID=5888 RepID=A0CWJ1_PARTE|nr:uncharacterized protein GSPATT00001361001 [Paramecium tetraurelia]CAK75158.1 unnamed protein product [Paramecium tetraurelia]|eukprot:XP_001442555.1 hypothetical protein (macronuclear) [Paramecium tetraurelia strain d4-2]
MSNPSHLKINSIVYIIQAPLGQGTFGKVYKAQQFSSKKVVAIKVQNQINESEKALLLQFKEKNFKNLVNIYDYEEQHNHTYIVMEYCSHSLYDQIQTNTINPKDTRYVFKQISNGLYELHSQGLAHRDLKPANILICQLQDRGHVQEMYKLCDFGTSKNSQRLTTACVGTPYYLAPEQLQQQTYDKSVDIWALGAVMYELFTNTPLFSGSTVLQIYDKIKNYEINAQIDNLNDLDIKYKNLLKSMLKKNPQERISIEEIRQKIEERVSMSVERKPQTNPANCQFKELKSLNLSKPINIPGQIQGQKPPLNLNVYPKKQPQFQQPNNTQPPILQNQLQNFNQNTQTQNQNLKQFQIPSEFQWQQRRSVPELAQNSSKIGK